MRVIAFHSLMAPAFIMLAALPVSAQDFDKTRLAGNNLAHEHMICAAYFTIVSECVKTRPDLPNMDGISNQYVELSKVMIERGRQFGNAAGVSEKASLARFKIALTTMMDDMDQSCSNSSVILAEYAGKCRELSENPAHRFEELRGSQERP